MQNTEIAVFFCILIADLPAAVRRTVIYRYDLYIFISLCRQTVKALPEMILYFIDGGNNANFYHFKPL